MSKRLPQPSTLNPILSLKRVRSPHGSRQESGSSIVVQGLRLFILYLPFPMFV